MLSVFVEKLFTIRMYNNTMHFVNLRFKPVVNYKNLRVRKKFYNGKKFFLFIMAEKTPFQNLHAIIETFTQFVDCVTF